jgi:hypothetical protein
MERHATLCISIAIGAWNCAFEISHLAADAACQVVASQNPTEQFFRRTRPFVVPVCWYVAGLRSRPAPTPFHPESVPVACSKGGATQASICKELLPKDR